MEEYITKSPEETKRVAEDLASKVKRGIVALTGELGAGKTTFVQGFAQGLGISDKILSPTFVLIRQHKTPKGNMLYHIDLYRLENPSQLQSLGLEEIFLDPDNLILIEWAEKAESLLPKEAIKISLEKIDEERRIITVTNLPV